MEGDLMIVYIAGPMTGIKEFNYPAFDAAKTELTSRGILTLNPADSELLNDTGKPQTWDWYMRHAIRMVTQSDAVCLLPGWETSKGVAVELTIARALELDVRPYASWISDLDALAVTS